MHCSAQLMLNPGVTVVVSPFVSFEWLRDGFGLRVFYTLTKHWHDRWSIMATQTHTLNLGQLCNRSSWGSDYFSANIFYDFGKDKPDCTVYPILDFCWDIPASMSYRKSVAKTNRVSLGVEVAF